MDSHIFFGSVGFMTHMYFKLNNAMCVIAAGSHEASDASITAINRALWHLSYPDLVAPQNQVRL